MQIKTVIFDLGGVLIHWDPMLVYRKIFPTEEEAQWFLENICTYQWNLQHDAGQLLQKGMDDLAATYPEWKDEIYAYYGRWEEMLGGVFEGTVKILKACIDNPNLQVVALTNWSAETFPIAKQRFDFLHWFEGIVVSGEEMMRKPNPKIYEIILERYQITPEHAVFIDDSLPNIEQANKMGIHGIHFQSSEQLKTALEKLGVF